MQIDDMIEESDDKVERRLELKAKLARERPRLRQLQEPIAE